MAPAPFPDDDAGDLFRNFTPSEQHAYALEHQRRQDTIDRQAVELAQLRHAGNPRNATKFRKIVWTRIH